MNNISRVSYLPIKNNKSVMSTISNPIEKEYLFLRIVKRYKINDIENTINFIEEENNCCFVEKMLKELPRDILLVNYLKKNFQK